MDPWIIGVDAGGTYTRAAAWSPRGGEVRKGRADGANWTVHGPDLCRERIALAVQSALPPGGAPESIAVCMAGYYPPEHGESVNAWLAATWPDVPSRLAATDVVGAWAGAHGGDPGLVLIGGTGSICYGRLREGSEARAGGWGPLYSDHGSAYTVGIACLRALSEQVDGIGPVTSLAGRVMARFPHPGPATDELTQWLRGIYKHRWDREPIARLSEEVGAAAAEGDATAAAILARAGRDLGALALAVERSLGEPGLPLVFQGGFLTASPFVSQCVEQALRDQGSTLRILPASYSPLEGSLLLAAEGLGGTALLNLVRSNLAAP